MTTETADTNETQSTDEIKTVDLDWYAEEEQVHIIPRNADRFKMHKDRAIAILVRAHKEEAVRQQFDFLVKRLVSWLDHNGRPDSYLTVQDGCLSFVVISKQSESDDGLENALADLDVDIANDPMLDLIDLDTMILPPASIGSIMSFLDRSFIFAFKHGKRS